MKPKNTGVGSLSFLQGIFPIQESNQGVLHCRRILYQLSYQGSPEKALYLFHLREVRKLQNKSFKLAEVGLRSFSKEAISIT